MKINEITPSSIKKVSDIELLNLHYRLHQLYQNAKKRGDTSLAKKYKYYHNLVVKEIDHRKLKHRSPLKLVEFFLENLQKNVRRNS